MGAVRVQQRPLLGEAFKYDGTMNSAHELQIWAELQGGVIRLAGYTPEGTAPAVYLDDINGAHRVFPGDWLVITRGKFRRMHEHEFTTSWRELDLHP